MKIWDREYLTILTATCALILIVAALVAAWAGKKGRNVSMKSSIRILRTIAGVTIIQICIGWEFNSASYSPKKTLFVQVPENKGDEMMKELTAFAAHLGFSFNSVVVSPQGSSVTEMHDEKCSILIVNPRDIHIYRMSIYDYENSICDRVDFLDSHVISRLQTIEGLLISRERPN